MKQNYYKINITNDLTHINGNAYYKCTEMTSIILHETLTHIGDYAFIVINII